MPLHNWSELGGWEGVHDIWLVDLLRHIKPQLPPGYRAHLGSSPTLAIGTAGEKPDVSVRHWPANGSTDRPGSAPGRTEPDEEVAVMTLEPDRSLYVTTDGRLAACVEIVSPGNKDRPSMRAACLQRYFGYLGNGVNLVLVDVHPRPLGFSFADALAAELQLRPNPLPTPLAVAYRVGEPAPDGGRFVARWNRPLAVGQPLPTIPLPLSVHAEVEIDLEATYTRAAADAYLT